MDLQLVFLKQFQEDITYEKQIPDSMGLGEGRRAPISGLLRSIAKEHNLDLNRLDHYKKALDIHQEYLKDPKVHERQLSPEEEKEYEREAKFRKVVEENKNKKNAGEESDEAGHILSDEEKKQLSEKRDKLRKDESFATAVYHDPSKEEKKHLEKIKGEVPSRIAENDKREKESFATAVHHDPSKDEEEYLDRLKKGAASRIAEKEQEAKAGDSNLSVASLIGHLDGLHPAAKYGAAALAGGLTALTLNKLRRKR